MASFFVELWESIFTPGPTPTVLKAANASFAALQVVLLVLLATTYSVHFVVLSVLCGGLWWSINWFATELAAAQAREKKEEEEDRRKKPERESKQPLTTGSDDSDTEVESSRVAKASGKSKRAPATAADAEPAEQLGELRQRGEVPSVETQSSVSTEDEWEKVSENENEKDKDK